MVSHRPVQHARGRGPRSRTRIVVRFGLAAATFVGIGAAATSAAWTDSAYFGAQASSASVVLKAYNARNAGCPAVPANVSSGNPCWVEAGPDAPVTINDPNFILANLVPNANGTDRTLTTTLYLYNAGTSTLNVVATCTGSGTLFSGTAPLQVHLGWQSTACTSWTATLIPGQSTYTAVSLYVTVPGNWPDSYKKQAGTLPVMFTGTAAS